MTETVKAIWPSVVREGRKSVHKKVVSDMEIVPVDVEIELLVVEVQLLNVEMSSGDQSKDTSIYLLEEGWVPKH